LIVHKGFKSAPAIAELLKRCRHIVGHFKHSNKAFGKLKEIQEFLELPEHTLFQVFFLIN
jgi:hypothetical protein